MGPLDLGCVTASLREASPLWFQLSQSRRWRTSTVGQQRSWMPNSGL